MVTIDDKPFLQLCVAKRLIDQALARDVYRRAKKEGRGAGAVLIADGLMAAHTVQALEREVERLAAPRVIAGFRIVKKLGEGGMATVFLAEQLSLQREVALKLMSPHIANNAESAERFLREARIAAAVNHPNIVGVIDVGRHEGQLYLAMELVTGGDAAQLAERLGGVLPEARALEILIDCTEGLGALSDARLIHRDIKPSNIFLTRDGRAKLGDLGLARSEDGADRLTVTGLLVGTPAFMSPEQAGAADLVDVRSDIYALGATLFNLATGQQPYIGNSPIAVVAKVLTEPVPDPQLINPRLSSATAALIRRALAKKPEDRFQTPAEFTAAQRAALAEVQLQPARTPTTPPIGPATAVTAITGASAVAQRRSVRGIRPRRPAGRPLPLIVAGLALIALAGGVWVMTHRQPPAADAVTPTPAAKPMAVESTPAANPVASAKPVTPAPGVIPAMAKPAWAHAAGRDTVGPWTDLRVGDAVQRLRWMPAASFRVGSTPDEPNYFGPERLAQATISSGFWIADTECTQALWRAVMGSNPAAHTGDDQLPVEQVTLYAAIDFTKALGKRFPSLLARLPSRDEWEYACRAGAATWWWCGNDADALRSVANLKDTNGNDRFWKSSPVRSLRANPWGLYDVHGNVAEWCLGNNTDRPAKPIDAELDQDDPINHRGLIRGGSFSSEAQLARSGALPYVGPEAINIDIGFRFIIVGDAPPADGN